MITIEDAAKVVRTGDLLLFRGRTAADRAVRVATNAPVNHVGMALVIDDLPPLLWHAELSQTQVDLWTGGHHRGVQLHDFEEAVGRWRHSYQQGVWLRQLEPEAGRAEEDAALRAVARMDGVGFPTASRMALKYLRGRGDSYQPRKRRGQRFRPEAAFCAETVAITLQEMGVVEDDRRAQWFDPGTFWSGAYLPLRPGWSYGKEVAVGSAPDPDAPVPSSRTRWQG